MIEPYLSFVLETLQRNLDEQQQPPATTQPLSLNPRLNELVIKPHQLSDYGIFNESTLIEEN